MVVPHCGFPVWDTLCSNKRTLSPSSSSWYSESNVTEGSKPSLELYSIYSLTCFLPVFHSWILFLIQIPGLCSLSIVDFGQLWFRLVTIGLVLGFLSPRKVRLSSPITGKVLWESYWCFFAGMDCPVVYDGARPVTLFSARPGNLKIRFLNLNSVRVGKEEIRRDPRWWQGRVKLHSHPRTKLEL